MTCFQLRHMLFMGLPIGGQPSLLDGVDHSGDFSRGQHLRGFTLDIANKPTVHHVIRHGGFKGAVANKVDNRMELMISKTQQGFERHQVQIVLAQGILKGMSAAIELLGPALVGWIAKYPPLDVLGLDHKQPEARDDHMIDLGSALRGRQGHVLEQVVLPLVEKEPDAQVDKCLPNNPLEPGRFDQGGNQQQGQQIPELA